MSLDLLWVLLLIVLVNVAPFIAHLLLHERLAWPLDFGFVLKDGKRLFGDHKTPRGVAAAMALGAVFAPLFGWHFTLGLGAGAAAMAGDLLSSFLKRRWGEEDGKPHWLVDQFFEALFPALLLFYLGGVNWQDLLGAVLLFLPIGYLGARFVHFLLW